MGRIANLYPTSKKCTEEKKTHQNSNRVDRGTDIDPDDPDTDVFVSDAINDEDSCHLDTINEDMEICDVIKIMQNATASRKLH